MAAAGRGDVAGLVTLTWLSVLPVVLLRRRALVSFGCSVGLVRLIAPVVPLGVVRHWAGSVASGLPGCAGGSLGCRVEAIFLLWPGGAGLPLKALLRWGVGVLTYIACVFCVQVQFVNVLSAPCAVVPLGYASLYVSIRSGAAGGTVVIRAGDICPV